MLNFLHVLRVNLAKLMIGYAYVESACVKLVLRAKLPAHP